MKEFESYLLSGGHVAKHVYVYYIRWVELAYEFSGVELGEILSDDLAKKFIVDFGKGHEGWQVKQAEHALSLYRYFLGAKNAVNESWGDGKGYD